MPNVLLPIQPGTLPPGTCYPSNPQDLLNLFSANQNAVLNGTAFYNFGDTKPDPSLNAYPWFRTIDSRWYYFSGDWISSSNLNANERRIFVGTPTDLITYDGGDNGAPSDRSGPMWVIDNAFDGRSPMGIGAIASSTPAKTLGLLESYGEGNHQLIQAELPDCAFETNQTFMPVTLDINEGQEFASGGSGARRQLVVTSGGSDTPHQTVHPVYGVQIIMPSGRLYYRVP